MVGEWNAWAKNWTDLDCYIFNLWNQFNTKPIFARIISIHNQQTALCILKMHFKNNQ